MRIIVELIIGISFVNSFGENFFSLQYKLSAPFLLCFLLSPKFSESVDRPDIHQLPVVCNLQNKQENYGGVSSSLR